MRLPVLAVLLSLWMLNRWKQLMQQMATALVHYVRMFPPHNLALSLPVLQAPKLCGIHNRIPQC